jgi:hypothetical protein
VTEAFEDVVKYLGEILDFVEEFPEIMEEFFSSPFQGIED